MKLDVRLLKSVLTVYDELNSNGISLVYMGDFSHEITKMFTTMAEDEIIDKEENATTKRRIYHVLIETLQNMTRHSDELTQEVVGKGLFLIGKKLDIYYVITSNKISADKKERLEAMLNIVNAATKDELKDMYRKQIKEGKLSNKGGAGLGLIDMARKTTGKLDFEFIPFQDDNSYLFVLKVEISPKELEKEENKKDKKIKEDETNTQENALENL
jgi:hypothetical protein